MTHADIAIIGGEPQERLTWVIRLRGKGLAVHTETTNRKRDKMFKSALADVRDKSDIIDLDEPDHRDRLQSLLTADFRVETRRVIALGTNGERL